MRARLRRIADRATHVVLLFGFFLMLLIFRPDMEDEQ